jgi:hypothetical protein
MYCGIDSPGDDLISFPIRPLTDRMRELLQLKDGTHYSLTFSYSSLEAIQHPEVQVRRFVIIGTNSHIRPTDPQLIVLPVEDVPKRRPPLAPPDVLDLLHYFHGEMLMRVGSGFNMLPHEYYLSPRMFEVNTDDHLPGWDRFVRITGLEWFLRQMSDEYMLSRMSLWVTCTELGSDGYRAVMAYHRQPPPSLSLAFATSPLQPDLPVSVSTPRMQAPLQPSDGDDFVIRRPRQTM